MTGDHESYHEGWKFESRLSELLYILASAIVNSPGQSSPGHFHGLTINNRRTEFVFLTPGNEHTWEEECFFDIRICNLPRNSRLCISICCVDRKDAKRAVRSVKKGAGKVKILSVDWSY